MHTFYRTAFIWKHTNRPLALRSMEVKSRFILTTQSLWVTIGKRSSFPALATPPRPVHDTSHGSRSTSLSVEENYINCEFSTSSVRSYDISSRLSFWSMWFNETSKGGILRQLPANHEQDWCRVKTIAYNQTMNQTMNDFFAYARMTIRQWTIFWALRRKLLGGQHLFPTAKLTWHHSVNKFLHVFIGQLSYFRSSFCGFFRRKNTLPGRFLKAFPGNLSSNFHHIFYFLFLKKTVVWKSLNKIFAFKKIPH